MTTRRRPTSIKSAATSAWEWVVAAIGGTLICAAIVYLVWFGLTTPAGLPDLELAVVRTEPVGSAYLVELAIQNRGPATAAAVQIEGRLPRPDGQEEISEVTVDFVPPKSRAAAILQFSSDPAARDLRLRIKGMAIP